MKNDIFLLDLPKMQILIIILDSEQKQIYNLLERKIIS